MPTWNELCTELPNPRSWNVLAKTKMHPGDFGSGAPTGLWFSRHRGHKYAAELRSVEAFGVHRRRLLECQAGVNDPLGSMPPRGPGHVQAEVERLPEQTH